MFKSFKFDTALILTAITAILYSWSTAHFNGVLSTLRLDSDLMERSFHQVIYSGLIISFIPIIFSLFFIWVIVFVYSHFVLPMYIDHLRGSVRNRRRLISFKQFWKGKRKISESEKKINNFFTKLTLIIFAVLFFLLTLAYFENKGKNDVKVFITKGSKVLTESDRLINIELNDKSRQLILLACGTKACAGFDSTTNQIYYFPSDKTYSFAHKLK